MSLGSGCPPRLEPHSIGSSDGFRVVRRTVVKDVSYVTPLETRALPPMIRESRVVRTAAVYAMIKTKGS